MANKTCAIKEFHLFAGIGGGIYGGELLGNECCAGVEIMPYARGVLKQRQQDGWMPKFPILPDVTKLAKEAESGDGYTDLDGKKHKIQFDVLCGGFPCQAFSTAAHGKNIASKNLWDFMFEFVKASKAPVVFGENVVLRAIEKARADLEGVGYKVERVRLGCEDLGADHRRNRFWLLAVRDDETGAATFKRLAKHISGLPKLTGGCWTKSPEETAVTVEMQACDRRDQLLGIGNAQSPFVAASAFRVLVNRHLNFIEGQSEVVSENELSRVYECKETWITRHFKKTKLIDGLVHTPTTMANYCCKSMMKHQGCKNYVTVFCGGDMSIKPDPRDAEYLMGFPLGASCPHPVGPANIKRWRDGNDK